MFCIQTVLIPTIICSFIFLQIVFHSTIHMYNYLTFSHILGIVQGKRVNVQIKEVKKWKFSQLVENKSTTITACQYVPLFYAKKHKDKCYVKVKVCLVLLDYAVSIDKIMSVNATYFFCRSNIIAMLNLIY